MPFHGLDLTLAILCTIVAPAMEEFSDAHENKTAEEIESSLENILYCTFKSRNQYEGLSSQVSKLKSVKHTLGLPSGELITHHVLFAR